MFFTFDHAEHTAPHLVKGGRMWRSVECLTNDPWFCVAVEEGSPADGGIRDSLILLYDEDDLEELLTVVGLDLRVASVWINSPGWMNGSDNCRFDVVTKITKRETGNGGRIFLYALESGRLLHEGPVEHPSTGSVEVVLYSRKM